MNSISILKKGKKVTEWEFIEGNDWLTEVWKDKLPNFMERPEEWHQTEFDEIVLTIDNKIIKTIPQKTWNRNRFMKTLYEFFELPERSNFKIKQKQKSCI